MDEYSLEVEDKRGISPPHGDLRDVAPLAGALGVVGVDGAVFPGGGGGGEGGGVEVVGTGIVGEEGDYLIVVLLLLDREIEPVEHWEVVADGFLDFLEHGLHSGIRVVPSLGDYFLDRFPADHLGGFADDLLLG